jgi:hypothetical protein
MSYDLTGQSVRKILLQLTLLWHSRHHTRQRNSGPDFESRTGVGFFRQKNSIAEVLLDLIRNVCVI